LLKIAENWSSIIFYLNTINFTEKLQEQHVIDEFFLLLFHKQSYICI